MAIDSASGAGRLTFGGLATGLDTSALVDALIGVERQPVRRMQARVDQVREQQELLRRLNTLLLAIREAARAIDNRSESLATRALEEELLAQRASSSDPDRLGAVASPSAAPGSHAVRVEALASAARRVSAAFASADAVVGSAGDTLRLDFGGETPIEITLSGDTTLAELADLVASHEANDGSVRASLLDDGQGGVRLIFSGVRTGAAHDVAVTTSLAGPGGAPFLDAALSRDAADARLVVLGVPIARASNEVSDALPGVTLSLRSVNDPDDPDDAFAVTVVRDDEAIAGRVQALVDAYNALRDFSLEQATVNAATEKAGPLSGDFTLRTVERTVQRALADLPQLANNPFRSLADIGIRFDRDGRLTLDRAALVTALDQNAGAVRQLLSGDGTHDGIATALGRALDDLTRTGDGTVTRRISSLDARARDLERQIERMEERLARREEQLLLQFSALERLVSSFQASAGFLAKIGQD